MASLFFLMIHPIGYPIYCGGKGKAMTLTDKGNGPFCCRMLVANCWLLVIHTE